MSRENKSQLVLIHIESELKMDKFLVRTIQSLSLDFFLNEHTLIEEFCAFFPSFNRFNHVSQ